MKRFALVGLVVAACSGARADEPCRLKMVGDIDFTATDDQGGLTIEATLDGTSRRMIVDTGGIATEISEGIAQELKLHRRGLEFGADVRDFAGNPFHWIATIPSLRIGTMHGTDVRALIAPIWPETDTVGAIAPDFLLHFEVEFDFVKHKMRLFSQDHCPGQVVYWTRDPAAVIPIGIDDSGHITTTATLDGKELAAIIDTGATFSTLKLGSAKRFFGLGPDSPGMRKTADENTYTYPFKSLSFGGLSFANPRIDVFDDGFVGRDPSTYNVLIGLHELRKLHLFVSYKEKLLYATAADAH